MPLALAESCIFCSDMDNCRSEWYYLPIRCFINVEFCEMSIIHNLNMKKEMLTMKFGCPLIAVNDIIVSRNFYEKVLHQKVDLDLGANVSFGDGFSIFAIQSDYAGLVDTDSFNIDYKGNDHELVFEEDNFDDFLNHLSQYDGIVYLHKAKEYPWGQRVTRFYDPDFHIIEVGESMESVFKRFYNQGMSIDEVAERTSHPVEFVRKYLV